MTTPSQSTVWQTPARYVASLARQVGGGGERTRTQRDAAMAFLVRIASAGLLYLSQVVLARWMGAFEYGVYVFVWTWVLVLSGLSTLGLPTLMIRLVPEYIEKGEPALLRGLLLGGRAVVFLAGTALAAAALLLIWLLGSRLDNHYVLPITVALACVPIVALGDAQDGIGRGRGWMGLALIPPYVLRPLLLLGCMTVAILLGLPTNAATAAGAAVVATWTAALVQMLLIALRFRGTIAKAGRRYSFRTWFAAAMPLLVITCCELALQNADVLILSAYLSLTEVGMYYAAAKTMSLVMFVHYAVGSAVANRFSAMSARGDHGGLQSLVHDAAAWTFWPSLAAALVILVLGKPLLWLFNPEFTAAYPVMFVLAVGFMVRASMGPAEYILNMLGEQGLCALGLAASAIIGVALSFALVPKFGMLGAATATSTALSTAALLNYVVARRRLGLEISIFGSLRAR